MIQKRFLTAAINNPFPTVPDASVGCAPGFKKRQKQVIYQRIFIVLV
jgi:hypothetical protein